METTMPNWPALWEREPGLKPERLVRTQDNEWIINVYSATAAVRICVPRDGDETIAALCRDAAGLWLCERGRFLRQIQGVWSVW
jgi:hypothetical protein